jgi:hypothetical protein
MCGPNSWLYKLTQNGPQGGVAFGLMVCIDALAFAALTAERPSVVVTATTAASA